jgi:hypothetical protein
MRTEVPVTAIRDAMEAIVAARTDGISLKALADFFDRLEWLLADSKPVGQTKLQWVLGADPIRCEIALLMKEAFLAENEKELRALLSQVRSNHPHLAEHCEQVICDWLANEELLGR